MRTTVDTPAPWIPLYSQIQAIRETHRWGYYDSDLGDYSRSLSPTHSRETLYSWCVERVRANPDKTITVVDLLSGPGCLADIRDTVMRETGGRWKFHGVCAGIETLPDKTFDLCEEHGISYIRGDIQADGTWRRIEEALDGRAADLVLERGLAGLNYVEFHTSRCVEWLSRIWGLMSEQDGFAALELPHQGTIREAVPTIVANLLRKNIDASYVTPVGYNWSTGPLTASSLLLRRTPGSPASIRPALLRAMASERVRELVSA